MPTYTVTYEVQNTRTLAVIESKQATDTSVTGAMVAVTQLLDHSDDTWYRILSITVTINHKEN